MPIGTSDRFILEAIAKGSSGTASEVATHFGISRQAGSRRIQRLVNAGLVAVEGIGRGVRYTLVPTSDVTQHYALPGLSEDAVWRELVSPIVADLAGNVRGIWQYGITEMINNAIDHSDGTEVFLHVVRDSLATSCRIVDDGVGIYKKIQTALSLYDPREAILELAKGKLTTDPARHSGEGIFFTSRMFDQFNLIANELHYSRDTAHDHSDYLGHRRVNEPGTAVFMKIANDSNRTTRGVFDQFAAPDEFVFAKTIVPVRLAQYEGDTLVSRSQAKRLAMRFDKFRQVVLDFEGVSEIGQAFSDELFRVFRAAHPAVVLTPVNMVAAVAEMVARAGSRIE